MEEVTSESAPRGARKYHFPILDVRGASLGPTPAVESSRDLFTPGTPPTSWLGESHYSACPSCGSSSKLFPRCRGEDPSAQDPADPTRRRTLIPGLYPRSPHCPWPVGGPASPWGRPLPELPGPWRMHLGWQGQGRWVQLLERRRPGTRLSFRPPNQSGGTEEGFVGKRCTQN